MFKEVCVLLKIVKTRTTPYRRSTENGQVERIKRTILQILRCFIQGQQEDWDLHLATVGMAIRLSPNGIHTQFPDVRARSVTTY